MQEKTREKIKEIQQMINDGVSMNEIKKKKFKNSPQVMNQWLEKYGQYLKMKEAAPVPKVQDIEEKGLSFIPTPRDIEKLQMLLENAEDLMKLLSEKEEIEEINILTIPEELLRVNSDEIEISSIRWSKDIKKRFNQFCEKNKQYSKTALINAAFSEFMEKYK